MSVSVLTVSVIHPNGSQDEVEPSWDVVKKALNNVMLEPVWLSDGSCLLVDEEGLLKNLPYNPLASQVAGQPLVGTAALVRKRLVKKVLG